MSIDFTTLLDYETRKLIKHATHPLYDLHIWNYAETVQYSRQWDDITTLCRGLITDGTGRIIARSFKKFFNMEEMDADKVVTLANCGYDVAEKMDGSLGILFYYAPENKWIMTSRGSFISEQAKMGEKILRDKLANFDDLNKDWSYVFEIIYPENKIVVDYGDKRDIVLLAIVNNTNGAEIALSNIAATTTFTIVSTYGADDFAALKARNVANAEGYVIHFHDAANTRMKIKFETYCTLHRYMSNITVKTVYQMAKEGKTFEACIELIPDEFMDWFAKVWNHICEAYNKILADAVAYVAELKCAGKTGREFAMAIKDNPRSSLLFAISNGQAEQKTRALIYDKYMSYQEIECIFPGTMSRKH